MDSYGESERKDSLYYLWEKTYNIPLYVFRKCVLAVCLVLLNTVRVICNVLGFNFSGSVGDREAWIWKPYKNVPFYRAYVDWEWERVN